MSDTTDTDNPAGAAPGPDPFAAIEAEAGRIQSEAVPVDPNAPPPADPKAEAREAVEFAASLLLPILPDRYAVKYGPREVGRIGDALGAWCEARGVTMGDMMGKWMPELALIAAVIGPALPVLVHDVKARQQQQAQVAPRPQAQPMPQAAGVAP